jgi:large subunit ribosomal protein L10
VSKERKVEQIEQLADKLSRSSIVVATDYRGLSVAEMTVLRRQLRQQGMEYRVVKNTLTSLAAEKAERPQLSPLLKGPTALAFGYGDVVQLANILIDYQRSEKTTLRIKGGLLEGRALSADEILTLSSLPSREVLIAKLMGTLYGPIYGLLYVLSADMRQLLGVLQARIKQLEGG